MPTVSSKPSAVNCSVESPTLRLSPALSTSVSSGLPFRAAANARTWCRRVWWWWWSRTAQAHVLAVEAVAGAAHRRETAQVARGAGRDAAGAPARVEVGLARRAGGRAACRKLHARRRRRVRLGLCSARQRHLVAGRGEQLGARQPDAARRTRDDDVAHGCAREAAEQLLLRDDQLTGGAVRLALVSMRGERRQDRERGSGGLQVLPAGARAGGGQVERQRQEVQQHATRSAPAAEVRRRPWL